MSEWILRPYPHDKLRTDEFLAQKIIAIGWPTIGDARERSAEELQVLLETTYPSWSARRVTNGVDCITQFTQDMAAGDLVLIVPRMSDFKGHVMLAEVQGDYQFEKSLATDKEGYPHSRSVRWVRHRIARNNLSDEIMPMLGQRGLTLTRLEGDPLRRHSLEVGWL